MTWGPEGWRQQRVGPPSSDGVAGGPPVDDGVPWAATTRRGWRGLAGEGVGELEISLPPLSLILLLPAAPLPHPRSGHSFDGAKRDESRGDGVGTGLVDHVSATACSPSPLRPSLALPPTTAAPALTARRRPKGKRKGKERERERREREEEEGRRGDDMVVQNTPLIIELYWLGQIELSDTDRAQATGVPCDDVHGQGRHHRSLT
uniref:Uncharacterized protein n=1 Tax=Oryza punctata TaxID=4537 RepID=A0A0E0LCN6_ORYPU